MKQINIEKKQLAILLLLANMYTNLCLLSIKMICLIDNEML